MAKSNAPMNALTGIEYKGSNVTTLMGTGRQDQIWATYRQWIKLGLQVQKGEKGTRLCKVRESMGEEDENGKKRTSLSFFSVFNIEQVDHRKSK